MSIRCKLGIHDMQFQKAFKCIAERISMIRGHYEPRVDAETVFNQCSRCSKVECYLTDGSNKSYQTAGFTARNILSQLGTKDIFLEKVAGRNK